ncbi:hypothetical protein Tco_0034809, partial [Tanacetum coccineum]
FGKQWKNTHVTWAQLVKKQDEDTTLQDLDGAWSFIVRRDGITDPSDAVTA